MKRTLDKSRTVFIHDFDGVHYAENAITDHLDFYARPKAEAATQLLEGMTYPEAVQMTHRSYQETHDPQLYYIQRAAAQGQDPLLFKQSFHNLSYLIGQKHAEANYSYIFQIDRDLNQLFEDLRPHIRHGLLTQSCATHWASHFLQTMQRLQYFDPACRLGFEECGFETKAHSTKPIQLAIEAMGAKPAQTVFIEDNLSNIARAKTLDADILTVRIHHGTAANDDQPDYVDLAYNTLNEFLSDTKKLHRQD